jgi:hypothetical protein
MSTFPARNKNAFRFLPDKDGPIMHNRAEPKSNWPSKMLHFFKKRGGDHFCVIDSFNSAIGNNRLIWICDDRSAGRDEVMFISS